MKSHHFCLGRRFAAIAGAAIVLGFSLGRSASARPVHEVSVSLGEAPYSPASDMRASVMLPQAGYGLGFEWGPFGGPFAHSFASRVKVTPYLQAELGRYNQAWVPEATGGMRMGYVLGWLRPELQFAMGWQSVRHREFTGLEVEVDEFESETLHQRRRWSQVGRLGMRLYLLECLTIGLSAHWVGVPMWRFELGYKLGSLMPLLERGLRNEPL
jgi:hypothetical protein